MNARQRASARPGTVRLDRALSKLGIASRAEAGALIRDGRVAIAGKTVTDPGRLVVPETARIAIDRRDATRAEWRAVAFHKPRGVVTTSRDPEGRTTVFDVLKMDVRGLRAVGRLDLASSGLLLFTTDTQLAAWLTDPASRIVRRYAVTVRGELDDDAAAAMERGIAELHAASVHVRKRSGRETHLIVELTEGQNREIRRLVEAVGHEVKNLKRIAFGPIELGSLRPGAYREVSREEITRAFPGFAGRDRRPAFGRVEERRGGRPFPDR